ncbi:MAG TPA: glycosyltransferase [Gammaproteobacteria bacterium]|nr:glycosyltransferase [Gammaproteobacteria bacterium]
MKSKPAIYLSVVIPVYNEQDNLKNLTSRLMKVCGALKRSYEIIFVNDGSRDKTPEMLNALQADHSKEIRVVHFNGNFGQHMAVMAGFEYSRGEVVVTLDADLQNPPEEIPKLLAEIEKGHDSVGGIRIERQDSRFRKWASKLNNKIRYVLTGIKMTDQGCMLRAYSRKVADLMVQSYERSAFIPALAYTLSANPTEVEVEHSDRAAGTSKYNLYKLLRLNFDLMTGFSLLPLQIFTLVGMLVSVGSFLFVIYMFIRRLIVGPEAYGLFTLFAILYFLVGIVLMGLGIMGEYIGRIHQNSRSRPKFIVQDVREAE